MKSLGESGEERKEGGTRSAASVGRRNESAPRIERREDTGPAVGRRPQHRACTRRKRDGPHSTDNRLRNCKPRFHRTPRPSRVPTRAAVWLWVNAFFTCSGLGSLGHATRSHRTLSLAHSASRAERASHKPTCNCLSARLLCDVHRCMNMQLYLLCRYNMGSQGD